MKILRSSNSYLSIRIRQLKDPNGDIREEETDITNSPETAEPANNRTKKFMNIGSEEIAEISVEKIQLVLSQIKNGKAPGGDKISTEIMKMGGTAT